MLEFLVDDFFHEPRGFFAPKSPPNRRVIATQSPGHRQLIAAAMTA
jgi:hypothetical protein